VPRYPVPASEKERLALLHTYRLLDTPPEPQFDRVAWLAAEMLGCPIALVSLVDEHRQWFKASVGLGATETPREQAFCTHAIMDQEVLVVPDAQEDPRFRENPLVTGNPNIRFYAGAPLHVDDDHGLGTLCVIDRQPRRLSDREIECLQKLRDITVDAIEQRAQIVALQDARAELLAANEELDLFSHAIGHDLAAPVRNISVLGEMFEEDYGAGLSPAALEDVQRITKISKDAAQMVRELAQFARVSTREEVQREAVPLRPMLQEILAEVGATESSDLTVTLALDVEEVRASPIYLRQILTNLIDNARKYGGKSVRVSAKATARGWQFAVEDDGEGIDPALEERIFRPFYRLTPKDGKGTGVGLAWVRKLVRYHGGRIWLERSDRGGAAFRFELAAS